MNSNEFYAHLTKKLYQSRYNKIVWMNLKANLGVNEYYDIFDYAGDDEMASDAAIEAICYELEDLEAWDLLNEIKIQDY